MPALENFIRFFSPKIALRREQYLNASQILKEHARRYEGATKSRRTDGWNKTGSSSANNEIRIDLPVLRERSRDLVRNNGYAKKGIQAIRNNTVGTGIRPTPSKSAKLSQAETDRIKDRWWRWAETKDCDYDARENFYGLQKLIIGTVAESGECLVRRRRMKAGEGTIPVKLQVCEPDLLDQFQDSPLLENGGFIYQGVEFDKSMRRVAYWMFDRHPSDQVSVTSRRIPASDILHIFLQERAGQIRGVPWVSSVMIRMKDFDEYEDAQLVRQKIAACFSVFVEDSPEAQTGVSDMSADKQAKLDRVEPGIIEYLEPGKKVTFANPPAVEGYDTYTKKTLQGIAAGLGTSYETLSGDLGNVNFSSGRMGWLEFHRNIQEWQSRIMVPLFCDPVWEWFIQGLILTGALKDTDQWPTAEWTPPQREMIDPVKEIKGMSEKVRNGFSSWQDAVRQLGGDPDVVLAQLIEDAGQFDTAKLKLVCDARNDFIQRNSAKDNTPE